MEKTQATMLERLRAVQQFLDKFAARLGDVVKSGTRRQLDKAIADLELLSTRQATTGDFVKLGADKAKALRVQLVEKQMLPIVRIAQVDLPRTPEMARMKLPKGNPTPERLVQAAKAMAQIAAPYAQTFIEAGLPADFLAQLDAAANAVASYAALRKGTVGVGTAATTGLKDNIKIGNRVISAVDGLVRSSLDAGVPDDKVIRDEWAKTRTVRKTATQTPAPDPVPIPPATTTPTTPPAGGAA